MFKGVMNWGNQFFLELLTSKRSSYFKNIL